MPKLDKLFTFSLKDLISTLFILDAATVVCLILREFEHTDSFAPMIFILTVFLTARFTNGYLFGIIASVFGVLAVNYVFTFPYFKFNFTLSGYPLTIACMLAVSIVTSALTTKAKLQEATRMEMEREKTRGNLLRAVSHDLRTPLTIILGANSAVLDNYDTLSPDDCKRMLGEVNEEAEWLIRVVENLLTVTRMEGENAAALKKQPEMVEELLSSAVAKFKKRFPEQNTTVAVPDEMLMVPMDAILIEQVLINLLENSAFHARGASRTDIRAYRAANEAVFEVADDGCGFSSEMLLRETRGELISDRDSSLDGKRGMGIGLSVCKSIIAAHGGMMHISNKENGKNGKSGALVRFTLPLETETI